MRIDAQRLRAVAGGLAAVAALGSCKVGEPFAPTVENMAGNYTAGRLVTADAVGVVDWLKAGASLTLNLSSNGTTSGRLFMPGAASGGGDLDADMTGTWLLVGHTVFLGQAAETFMRGIDFTAGLDQLAGDQTFGDTVRVIVVLTK